MIFKLKNDFENTYSLLIENVELGRKMPAYRPKYTAKPRLHEWVKPEASFYYSPNFAGTGEAIPDITTWSAGVLVLNPKAYSLFENALAKSGEFLPIDVCGETYYLFNTLYTIPDIAINKESAVEVIDSGVHFGQSNVIFDEKFLASEMIMVFKTNTDKFLHSFCTGTFKEIYEKNGFKGLVFEKI